MSAQFAAVIRTSFDETEWLRPSRTPSVLVQFEHFADRRAYFTHECG
jgi:hypothetical protein